MTGGELGRQMGVARETVWAWQNGREPKIWTMNRIADLLGVSRWWLLTGKAGTGVTGRCPACGKRL